MESASVGPVTIDEMTLETACLVGRLYDERSRLSSRRLRSGRRPPFRSDVQSKGALLLHRHSKSYSVPGPSTNFRDPSTRTHSSLNTRTSPFVLIKYTSGVSATRKSRREDVGRGVYTGRHSDRWRLIYVLNRPHAKPNFQTLTPEIRSQREFLQFHVAEGAVIKQVKEFPATRAQRPSIVKYRFDERRTARKNFYLHRVEDVLDPNQAEGQRILRDMYNEVNPGGETAWKHLLTGDSASSERSVKSMTGANSHQWRGFRQTLPTTSLPARNRQFDYNSTTDRWSIKL